MLGFGGAKVRLPQLKPPIMDRQGFTSSAFTRGQSYYLTSGERVIIFQANGKQNECNMTHLIHQALSAS